MKIQERKFYPWLVILLLVVVSMLNYLDRQMLSTLRPAMQVDIKELESYTNFGRLMAIFLWIYALLSPISGMIADRLNRKWLIVGSLFVWSAVTAGMGFVSNYNVLLVLRGLMGISEAFYIPAALSLAADYHQGSTRSTAIGILTSGIYLGQILGGFGANVASVLSWQHTFIIFGVVGILYSFVLVALLREKKAYVNQPSEKATLGVEMKQSVKGLAVLLGNVAFWVMLYYFAALNLPGWTTKNWLPTLLSDSLEMPMEQAGPIAITSLALSSFVGVFFGGWLSDKWSSKNIRGRVFTSSTGLAMIIPALILMCFGKGLVVTILSAAVFGIGFGMYDSNNMPILCQFIPARYRATGYGMMNLVGIAAGALITTELGKAMDLGYKDIIFYLMIATVALAVILQLLVLKPKTLDMTDEQMAK